MDPVLVGGIFGTVLTQAVLVYIARRSKSGRVDTSEAATLWAESQSIRGELRARVVALEERVEELQVANETLRGENHTLRREVAELRASLEGLGRAR